MTQKLISLEQSPEDQRERPEIDLSPVTPPKLPQEVADERALRYHYTMGEDSPGPETLRTQINSFSENLIREQIALDRTIEEQEVRLGVLNTYMQARDTGKPLTPEDVSFVQELMKPQPIAPESIVERTYAEKVVDQITTMDDNPDMAAAYQEDPDFVLDSITVAQQMISKTLLARKIGEDLDAKWKELGTGSKALSYIEAFVPFLHWYRQTDLLKEADSIWLGGNKDEQIQYLYSLPLEEFHNELKKGLVYLWDQDPLTAFEFLNSVVEYSTTDAAWDTAFNVIDIASVLPVATAAKLAKGVKIAKTTKGVSSAKDAVKTQIKDTDKPKNIYVARANKPKQNVGTFYEIVPLNDKTFKLILPNLEIKFANVAEYKSALKKQGVEPPTHLMLHEGNLARVGSEKEIRDYLEERVQKGWFKAVDDPNSEEAMAWRSVGDEEAAVASKSSNPSRQKVRDQLKDIGKASADNKNLPAEILSASGRIEDAADLTAKQVIQETIAQKDPRRLFGELAKRTTSLLDPEKRLGVSKARLSDEYTRRLLETLERNQGLALGAIGRLPRMARQTLEAETMGLAGAKEALKQRYRHLDDSVVYWNNIRATDQVTNNATVEMVIGRPDAGIFSNADEARTWARDWYQLPPGSYSVNQDGVGYTIRIAKDVDETDVRSFLVNTNNTNPTNRFANYFFNKWFLKSGSKEKVSLEQREDRALVTHAMQELTRVASAMTDDVGNLSKAEASALNRVLDYNRSYIDPQTGDIGKYFNSLDELQTEFNRITGRGPTLREAQAYFSVVQLNDIEYVLTNLTLHSHKVRQGMEIYRFDFMSDTMAEKVINKFEGKLEKDIPWDDGNIGGILEVSPDGKSWGYFRKERVSPDEKTALDKLVNENGYKVIRVAAPDRQHFGVMGVSEDMPVNFVLLKNHDARPLRLTEHIPYKPGGHADYVDEFWTKQPKFVSKSEGGSIYKGDRAVFNHGNEAKAKKFTDAMERARFFLSNNMLKEFDDHVTKNLPFKPRELEDMFSGKTLEDGTFIDPRYDLMTPFVNLRSSHRSVDEYSAVLKEQFGEYEDLINTPYNMYKDIDKRHTGKRDPNAWTVENAGTPENPDFFLGTAKFLDPLKSTYQSLAKTIRSQYYEDYQIKSVESFIEQYADILLDAPGGRPGNKKKLYANIRDVLANPQYRHGADPAVLESAKHMRDAVVQMLGVQSHTANQIDGYMQRLANYAFSSGIGDRKLFGNKIQEWIPNNKMQYIKDPFQFFRAAAFRLKLGMFNPVTWFVQMQGVVPLMSIAGPVKAFKGGGAAYLHMLSGLNSQPEILAAMGKKAEGYGWKAKEWNDAHTLLRNSGFDIIGGSHAYLDDMASPKVFQGKVSKALEAGDYFFRKSEGFIRNASFFTAYEEALRAGTITVGKVNNRQLASILNRAENLALNMIRNANSAFQQGAGSTLTQFWGYQIRTFELLWGRNLTKTEKARLFAGTAAIYGLPVGLSSAAAPLWPLQESIRQGAIENGYDPDSGLVGLILQGAPQLVLSMITGEDYNIAERWGPGGIPAIKTALEGDFQQAVIDLGMGASGSIFADILGDLNPFVSHARFLSEADNTTYGEILTNDLIRAARNISSINNAYSLGTALATGQYITKNDTVMGSLDTVDAILKSATGLTPNHIQDTHLMRQSIVNRRDKVNQLYSAMLPDMKAYKRAVKDGNEEQKKRSLVAIKAFLAASGLRKDEEYDVISRLFKDNMDMQGQTYLDFIEKGDIAPENQDAVREQIRERFKRIEE
jgi:hypothetical protein